MLAALRTRPRATHGDDVPREAVEVSERGRLAEAHADEQAHGDAQDGGGELDDEAEEVAQYLGLAEGAPLWNTPAVSVVDRLRSVRRPRRSCAERSTR